MSEVPLYGPLGGPGGGKVPVEGAEGHHLVKTIYSYSSRP